MKNRLSLLTPPWLPPLALPALVSLGACWCLARAWEAAKRNCVTLNSYPGDSALRSDPCASCEHHINQKKGRCWKRRVRGVPSQPNCSASPSPCLADFPPCRPLSYKEGGKWSSVYCSFKFTFKYRLNDFPKYISFQWGGKNVLIVK